MVEGLKVPGATLKAALPRRLASPWVGSVMKYLPEGIEMVAPPWEWTMPEITCPHLGRIEVRTKFHPLLLGEETVTGP
jgi:hypothetical protein